MIAGYLLESTLEISAARAPGHTALVCGTAHFAYGEIDAWANSLAHALIASGVRRGDRVAKWLENSPGAVSAIFATLKAGAVFVPVNPSTKRDKLEFLLADSGASALVTGAGKFHPSGVAVLTPDDADGYPSTPPAKQAIDRDLAAIIYTSGSTGRPKGVMLTHLNMMSAANSIAAYLENTASDVIISVLPLSFDYGLYQVFLSFQAGAKLVLERGFAYPFQAIEAIQRERVTGFPLVPTISAVLLKMDLRKFDLSSLRYITNTASALPPAHIARLRELLPSVKLFSMYGLTECKRVSYLPPEEIDRRPGSVGRAMPNVEVWIEDECGERLPNGCTGELVVRGSNVMSGYWNRPEETAQVLKPGPLPDERVLHTGDLFRTDDEGYLYFVARKDDIIKCRGEKVSPREIENALSSMPGIAEVAVIGVPDAILGEAIWAFIAAGGGLTPRDVLRYCAGILEEYLVPQCVEILPELPKSPNGKVDKHELVRRANP
jgi:acyl-CoA synthetase (AMP-forming)/AMP-acid ligase II